jgi:hypothetical protein
MQNQLLLVTGPRTRDIHMDGYHCRRAHGNFGLFRQMVTYTRGHITRFYCICHENDFQFLKLFVCKFENEVLVSYLRAMSTHI